MNSKQKIAAYVALIFLAGGVTGGSIAWTASTKTQGPPPRREFPDAKRMCDFMMKRLEERVGLTPEQISQIQPMLESSAREIRAIHGKTLEEIEAVIRRTHSEIAATLTPEQKARLDEVENERREFWRKHLKKKDYKGKDRDDWDGKRDYPGKDEKRFWDKWEEDPNEQVEEGKGPNACNTRSADRPPARV